MATAPPMKTSNLELLRPATAKPLCRLAPTLLVVVGVSEAPGGTQTVATIVVTTPPGRVDVMVLVFSVVGLFVLVVPETNVLVLGQEIVRQSLHGGGGNEPWFAVVVGPVTAGAVGVVGAVVGTCSVLVGWVEVVVGVVVVVGSVAVVDVVGVVGVAVVVCVVEDCSTGVVVVVVVGVATGGVVSCVVVVIVELVVGLFTGGGVLSVEVPFCLRCSCATVEDRVGLCSRTASTAASSLSKTPCWKPVTVCRNL